MPGTKAGGRKAAATNLARYGKDFYKNIGQKGGRNGHTGGFAARPDLATKWGVVGGRRSRRGEGAKPEIEVKKDEITRLYESGASFVEIAKATGLRYHSVRYWIKKNLEDGDEW